MTHQTNQSLNPPIPQSKIYNLKSKPIPHLFEKGYKSWLSYKNKFVAHTKFPLNADVFLPSEGVRIFNFYVIIKRGYKK